jgi:DNA-binding beta-propeller fold protein YncE
METMGLSEYPLSVGDDPETIIVDSIGQYAYLLDGGNVHKVNLAEKTYVTFPQPAGTDEIGDFDLTPDGSRAILNDADNWIYLIETSSWTLIDKKQVNTNRFTESGQVAVSYNYNGYN